MLELFSFLINCLTEVLKMGNLIDSALSKLVQTNTAAKPADCLPFVSFICALKHDKNCSIFCVLKMRFCFTCYKTGFSENPSYKLEK